MFHKQLRFDGLEKSPSYHLRWLGKKLTYKACPLHHNAGDRLFSPPSSIKLISKISNNKKGFGLVSAIFVIVILAMFGLLVARFVATTSVTSSEDYLWGQALYAAESAARLRILYNDGGGVGVLVQPQIGRFNISETDNFPGPSSPATLRIEAAIPGLGISREVEVKYIL